MLTFFQSRNLLSRFFCPRALYRKKNFFWGLYRICIRTVNCLVNKKSNNSIGWFNNSIPLRFLVGVFCIQIRKPFDDASLTPNLIQSNYRLSFMSINICL